MEEKNKQKLIITVIVVLLAVLVGIGSYFLFIKKDDNKSQEGGNHNENSEQSHIPIISDITYKTKNGQKVLKIFSDNNTEMINKAREQLKNSEDGFDEDYFIKDDYHLGEYNGKLIVLYSFDGSEMSNIVKDKYEVFIGDDLGESSQCGQYHFIVSKSGELLDLKYDEYGYGIYKMFDKYYIIEESGCVSNYGSVYTEDLTKLADDYVNYDEKGGYLYVLKDGYLLKLDKNNNVVKKGTIKFDDDKNILGSLIVDNDKAYSLISINKLLYVYDFNADAKYKIYNGSMSYLYPFDTVEGEAYTTSATMELLDNKLLIILFPDSDNKQVYPWTYFFDMNTKKLEKKGYYLLKDFGENPKYFYLWNEKDGSDESIVYKYDYKGNVVSQAKYTGKDYYMEYYDRYFAYDGSLYWIVWDDEKYYLEEPFANKKYEIADFTNYEYRGGDIVTENDEIEIILMNNKTKVENSIYFNMITKKVSR